MCIIGKSWLLLVTIIKRNNFTNIAYQMQIFIQKARRRAGFTVFGCGELLSVYKTHNLVHTSAVL